MRQHAALTLVLAMCTMMGALGIDTYLPSFPAIGQALDASPATVQQTLSVYVLAMAITMLFYGTLSDTFGRQRVLLLASCGFAITSLAAVFTTSIEGLIAWRFAQGAMAGAGMVIARAFVQDRFQGADAQRMMSLVMFCFGLAPAIAPMLGGWLQAHYGWRANFVFLAVFGLLLCSLCWCALPESLAPDKRVPLNLRTIAANYLQALRHGQFRLMVLGLALMSAGIGLYISAASQFVTGILDLPITAFAWLFVPLIAGSMLGSAISGLLAKRIALTTQKRWGYASMLLGCLSNLAYHSWTATPTVPWAVLPIACYTFGTALLTPILSLQIMGLFPHMRGLASSLQGFTQMGVFALMAGLVAPQLFHSGWWLAVGHAVAVITGMLLWWLAMRAHTATAQSSKG